MKKEKARELVEELWKKYFEDDFKKPEVKFRDGKRYFGKADYTNNILVLSERYVEQHRDREDIIDTIKHELAHFKVYSDGNYRKPHGEDWQRVVTNIGGTPKRVKENVNDVDLNPKYVVKCKNCGWSRGYFRKGKAIKNIESCICPKCRKKKLTYDQKR